jgi:hypothetical protein
VNDLFAKLRRLLDPRPRPSVGEATADRPPPPAPEPLRAEPPPAVAPEPIPAEPEPIPAEPEPIPAKPPPVEARREPTSLAADDLAEVRAALDAVAETPLTTPETEADVPPTPVAPPAALPTPAPESIQDRTADSSLVAATGDALVLKLGTPPTTFTVAKASATLGRGQENTIRLDDLSVSRRHARIAYRQGGYWLSDLGSMGGTWVNGTRLSAPRRITSGEVIDIGLCRLTVSFVGGSAKAETKKRATKSG